MDNSQMNYSQVDNRGFLDIMNVGSNEVNWSVVPDSSPIAEQEVPVSAKPRSKKGASTKGKNWSSLEDKVLIQAWANTSLDAITGTDQNSNCYWGRIFDYYNAHKHPSWPERNANGLGCRYASSICVLFLLALCKCCNNKFIVVG
uniref:Uncharacterized protein n=1 Tax=Avena sativa TaxID=4498 RepID=A0ACD5ZD75_AVESA